ncbi:MAG: hypothetical protein U0234_23960 [Sandaracinus sp.]
MALITCSGCTRHVRSTDESCPFCGLARVPETVDESVVRAPTRAGVMLGVTLGAVALSSAVLGTACSAYGGPPYREPDAGQDAATPQSDTGPDAP